MTDVAMVKVADVDPAGTVIVAGTVAAATLLEVRFTADPPVGAAAPRVTVPVEDAPPATMLGETVRLERSAGLIVSAALRLVPDSVAVMVAVETAVTADVVMLNVAVVAPAGTVTLAGTVAEVLLEARFTTAPPVGAAVPRVTVPVDGEPPTTLVGDRVKPANAIGLIVSEVLTLTPEAVAVIVEVDTVETAEVETVNVVEKVPGLTVMDAGTEAEPVALRLTTTPFTPATPLKVTVPTEVLPPTTVLGLTVTPVRVTPEVTVKVALLE